MNINEWNDISEIDECMDHYEFNNYVVLVADIDEDGEVSGDYEDIAFGIALIPEHTRRFFLVPYDEGQ